MARTTHLPSLDIGDLLETPSGNISVVRSIDNMLNYVQLANGDSYPVEYLYPIPKPDSDTTEALQAWIDGPTYRVVHPHNVRQVTIRCDSDRCNCQACYVVAATTGGDTTIGWQHFTDNATCTCSDQGCPCAR